MIVVVLGAHRSGTSMLSRILHALGLALGENVLREPSFDNALGYWEHAGIVAEHEALLERLDRVWNGPHGMLPFAPGWWRSEAVAPFRARLKEIVVREASAAAGIWGFKDPRTARLLPMWREILEEAGLRALYLLSVRDPREVAASLARRDRITRRHGELLWLQHNLDAVRYADERLAAVLPYERWFTDGVALAEHLVAALGLPALAPERIAERLMPLLRADLRHEIAGAEAPELPCVAELHRLLIAHAPAPPEREAMRALEIRAQAAMPGLIAAVQAIH